MALMTEARTVAVDAIGALVEPVRRALYDYVARQPHAVGRDEAARAVGVSRSLAAFHLDKLVEVDLLQTTYRRLSEKTGPGAGRPSKLYRRSGRAVAVTIPERRHELLADLLARGLQKVERPVAADALTEAARELGEAVGAQARRMAGSRARREQLLRSAEQILDEFGFAPYRAESGTIRLRNCPFDPVSARFRDLVCGMNLSLLRAVLDGLRASGVSAELDPQPEMCCVVLRRANRG